ncbi:MAG: DUF433 domain-containing protein [Parafilimonas sp.]
MTFERISIDPKVMLGKPCIKGTRITVELILAKLAQGADYNYLLRGYPNLTLEDIRAAIAYAHAVLTNERIIEAEPA